MSDTIARRLLWYLFAGSKGGENRIKIIKLLWGTPLNINRMAEVLDLDYKAVQHHVDVLEKNNLVSNMGEKYGIMYSFQTILSRIWIRLRKSSQK
jgi:predicted transcriptional regulator